MAHLYLTEDNLKLGYSNGRVTVRSREGTKIRDIPAGMVDGMSVYGQAQLSTQLIRHCIEESKSITYYSDDGHYFGGIQSFDRLDPCLQKKQVYLTDNRDFCLCWSYRIVYAKIQNSLTMLKGLSAMYEFSEEELKPLRHSLDNIERAGAVEEILGYEGNAAKGYFRCLSRPWRTPALLSRDAVRGRRKIHLTRCFHMGIAFCIAISSEPSRSEGFTLILLLCTS